jgi:Mn-dependent DtxR family transcriptional regulator
MSLINDTYEDYLKAIYIVSKKNKGGWVSNSEISNFLKVKPASVSNMLFKLLFKLQTNDLINWRPRKSVRLSTKGKDIAIGTINKYNLWKRFFINVLGVNDSLELDELCCKIEHLITPEISDALENFLLEEVRENL